MDFPGGSSGKAFAYNARDQGLIPGSGRSPGEGNDNPLQYSCLENPMDRGDWLAIVHGVAKSQTRLNDFTSLPSLTSYFIAGEGNGNPLRVLAWRIPWTEKPGRLRSTGSQRVRHD